MGTTLPRPPPGYAVSPGHACVASRRPRRSPRPAFDRLTANALGRQGRSGNRNEKAVPFPRAGRIAASPENLVPAARFGFSSAVSGLTGNIMPDNIMLSGIMFRCSS